MTNNFFCCILESSLLLIVQQHLFLLRLCHHISVNNIRSGKYPSLHCTN